MGINIKIIHSLTAITTYQIKNYRYKPVMVGKLEKKGDSNPNTKNLNQPNAVVSGNSFQFCKTTPHAVISFVKATLCYCLFVFLNNSFKSYWCRPGIYVYNGDVALINSRWRHITQNANFWKLLQKLLIFFFIIIFFLYLCK